MPDSKEFGLSDYALLSMPYVGDLLWALKRKAMGQNDFIPAQDYAIRGDSHGLSKVLPLLSAGAVAGFGHHLPGMKPNYKFRKALRPLLGRAGLRIAGRYVKPALWAFPTTLLSQAIVSGEFTRRALQDKSASWLGFQSEEDKRKQMAHANVAASLGGGLAPYLLSKGHMKYLVPSLYKNVPEALNDRQKSVFDRFIRSKNFSVSDIARDFDNLNEAANDLRAVKVQRMAEQLNKLDPRASVAPLNHMLAELRVPPAEPFGKLDYLIKKNLAGGPFFMPAAPKDGSNFLSNIIQHIMRRQGKADKKTKGFINMPSEFFDDLGRAGNALRNPILAHEVGHGVGPKAYLVPGMRALSNLLPALAVGNILYTNDEATGRNTALASPFLSAPLMASEIDASMRGSKILSKLAKGKLSFLQKLAPFAGVPTYAALAASPALTHVIKKNMGGYREEK